jgi:hypothetical protein
MTGIEYAHDETARVILHGAPGSNELSHDLDGIKLEHSLIDALIEHCPDVFIATNRIDGDSQVVYVNLPEPVTVSTGVL